MTKIIPFGEDGIDCLSIDDKLKILCAPNPINAIVKQVNCRNQLHHNVLLEKPESKIMHVYNGEKMIEADTDLMLALLIETKITDLVRILRELSEYLDEQFTFDMSIYLLHGCNKQPNFRPKVCKPKEILKKNIKLSQLRKKFTKA